jgi:transcriptional regulator with XRE-family HTH domain
MPTEKRPGSDLARATGKRIKEVMKDLDKGVVEFAKDLHMENHSTVSAWIAGETVPGGDNVRAIAIAGKVTADWLLSIPGAPKSPDDRLTREDFRRYMTEEVIREGNEEWNRISASRKLPAGIREAFAETITPGAVKAVLARAAKDLVEHVWRREVRDELFDTVRDALHPGRAHESLRGAAKALQAIRSELGRAFRAEQLASAFLREREALEARNRPKRTPQQPKKAAEPAKRSRSAKLRTPRKPRRPK